jgi:hypothetical protein
MQTGLMISTLGEALYKLLTCGGILYLVHFAWKFSPILNQHKMMWFEYSRAHDLPVEGDLHGINGGTKAQRAAAGG